MAEGCCLPRRDLISRPTALFNSFSRVGIYTINRSSIFSSGVWFQCQAFSAFHAVVLQLVHFNDGEITSAAWILATTTLQKEKPSLSSCFITSRLFNNCVLQQANLPHLSFVFLVSPLFFFSFTDSICTYFFATVV
jgi:hypothetical protein